MNTAKFTHEITRYASTKDIYLIKEILPSQLIFDPKIREYCEENKCGKYGKNFMCPPYVGSIGDFKEKVRNYNSGLLVLVHDKVNNPNDLNDFYRSAIQLHKIMLDIENKANVLGYYDALTLIGGDCKLCRPCNAVYSGSKCRYPSKARSSMEAMGIDVIETCKNLGINIQFKKDEVTWVGLLLL